MKNFETIFIATVQAQETSPPPKADQKPAGNIFSMFLPMILVFAIFYLLLIRPQAKQRKQHRELLKNIKKGDEVVTTSGIHGRIAGIADTIVTLEVGENVRIKLDRQQVATIKQSAPQ